MEFIFVLRAFVTSCKSILRWPSWSVIAQVLQIATSQFLQKNFSSSFSWSSFWQNIGRLIMASMSWSWKYFSASVLCSLLVRIMLCANIHSSHQKEQHWKQYKVWALRFSQFPHFTLAVLHSLIAKTSTKLLIRKLVGSSLGFPLPGILNCFLHSGHVILPWTPLVRWIPFRQWRQKLCKQGNCFGSVNERIHTEQDTSSWRLSSKVFISISRSENKVNFGLSKKWLFGRNEPTLLWPRQKLTNQNECLHFADILMYYIPLFLVVDLRFKSWTIDMSRESVTSYFTSLSSTSLRGTQRQFLENICSEDDFRSRIFGTFVVKFLACLPLLGFSNI